ncbi:MAG TPA: ferritin-like domain-containing protein [Polyangiaceae bacterium]
MLSVHSLFALLVAPLIARRRASAARMLARFAKAELGSSLILRWAAAATTSADRRALYLRHALDEERHARLFSARARKLGAKPEPVVADADDLFRELGERRFVAFVHRAESRGEREFTAYERWFRRAGDRKTAAVFEVVLRDERRHVEYSKLLFAELGAPRITSLAVALWETLRASRRMARAAIGALNHLFLVALYVTLLPFSLVQSLRSRPKKPRLQREKTVLMLER